MTHTYLLIDTDKLEMTVDDNGKIVIPLGSFNMAIAKFVHCKECWCWNEEEQHGCTHDMGANDFCSKAKRKEE